MGSLRRVKATLLDLRAEDRVRLFETLIAMIERVVRWYQLQYKVVDV